MNKTYPSTEVWIQMNNQLQKNIQNNKIKVQDLTSLNFAFDDLALLQHQLNHSINLWKTSQISQNDFLLINQQIPFLINALNQNLSTLTTMLILDLFILMAFKHYDNVGKVLIQNFGVPYLLNRIQDENLEVCQKSFKLLGIIPKNYLNDIDALPILINISLKICVDSHEFFDIIIEIARYTKRKAHLQLVCKYILQANYIDPLFYLKKVVYLIHKSPVKEEVSKIFLEYQILVVLRKIKKSLSSNNEQIYFYCINLISILKEHSQQSKEFISDQILDFFHVSVDKHNYTFTEIYSKSLCQLISHDSNLIKEIIKNQQIMQNLLNFYDQKAIVNFILFFNRLIELDLEFEIKYLIKKGVLSKYYCQLNPYNLGLHQTLLGIQQLLKKGYIKDNLNLLQKKVRNSSAKNQEDKNLQLEIIRLIQQEKQ
ncbi:unnamed protein product [Paramecium sonneborni]|uniref:Uncharacterized protein n=1 Tax=Paramecium sonneborni TaxID=65129 RepID=A0A8S1KIE4_9CILI|nr:unnamed protein product [Paramecium sonneborni]